MSPNSDIYQLKVTLKGAKPPLWRRIEVNGNVMLDQLHRIFQAAMGWTHSHLHQFTINDVCYSDVEFELMHDHLDQRHARLDRLVTVGDILLYEYDFGDGWEHRIAVEKVFPSEANTKYPNCSAGKRACPPEDCGGVHGYHRLVDILSDPTHEEHQSTLEWVGPYFLPNEFSSVETTELMS